MLVIARAPLEPKVARLGVSFGLHLLLGFAVLALAAVTRQVVVDPPHPPPLPIPSFEAPRPRPGGGAARGPRPDAERRIANLIRDQPPVAPEVPRKIAATEPQATAPEALATGVNGEEASAEAPGGGGAGPGPGNGVGIGQGPGGPGTGTGTGTGTSDVGPAGMVPTAAWSEPVRVSSDIVPPVPESQPDPRYPEIARRSGHEGDVKLDCIIGTDGSVRVKRVVQHDPLLERAAIEAVEQWRYHPARWNGHAQAVLMVVTVSFEL